MSTVSGSSSQKQVNLEGIVSLTNFDSQRPIPTQISNSALRGQVARTESIWSQVYGFFSNIWKRIREYFCGSSLADRNIVDLTEVYCGNEVQDILGCNLITDANICVFLTNSDSRDDKNEIKERVLELAWNIENVSSQLVCQQTRNAVIRIANEISKGSQSSAKMNKAILGMAKVLLIAETKDKQLLDAVLGAASRLVAKILENENNWKAISKDDAALYLDIIKAKKPSGNSCLSGAMYLASQDPHTCVSFAEAFQQELCNYFAHPNGKFEEHELDFLRKLGKKYGVTNQVGKGIDLLSKIVNNNKSLVEKLYIQLALNLLKEMANPEEVLSPLLDNPRPFDTWIKKRFLYNSQGSDSVKEREGYNVTRQLDRDLNSPFCPVSIEIGGKEQYIEDVKTNIPDFLSALYQLYQGFIGLKKFESPLTAFYSIFTRGAFNGRPVSNAESVEKVLFFIQEMTTQTVQHPLGDMFQYFVSTKNVSTAYETYLTCPTGNLKIKLLVTGEIEFRHSVECLFKNPNLLDGNPLTVALFDAVYVLKRKNPDTQNITGIDDLEIILEKFDNIRPPERGDSLSDQSDLVMPTGVWPQT